VDILLHASERTPVLVSIAPISRTRVPVSRVDTSRFSVETRAARPRWCRARDREPRGQCADGGCNEEEENVEEGDTSSIVSAHPRSSHHPSRDRLDPASRLARE